ncbi:MAG TPA: hypothetical protein VFS52_19750 [Steroidobacteraceae bacterium]|jgi:hypothetical protein|nr:hypothetical protein [Steroidobacteraceae bacterium]
MKNLTNTPSRPVAKVIAIRHSTRDPLWVITIGMGAFFAIVAALVAIA